MLFFKVTHEHADEPTHNTTETLSRDAVSKKYPHFENCLPDQEGLETFELTYLINLTKLTISQVI